MSLTLAACQGDAPARPASRRAIEVWQGGERVASVTPGHPCRATVEGAELLVGGRPLVAQYGSSRWTGEDAANGTTLSKNDQVAARIHAKQLFDSEGVPLVRVMENGDITNANGRVVRQAIVRRTAGEATIEIGDVTVTGLDGNPDDIALAAMLTAREASPEVRALAACHYLLPNETKS